MLRTLREAMAIGIPVIILLDVPWSSSEAVPDMYYPINGASFRGLSTVARLVDVVSKDFATISAVRNGAQVIITEHEAGNVTEAFKAFGELLHKQPFEYERLHELHEYCTFDEPRSVGITFEAGDARYVMNSRSMKAWRIGTAQVRATGEAHHVAPVPPSCVALAGLFGEPVEASVAL